MIRYFLTFLLLGSVVFLTSCTSEEKLKISSPKSLSVLTTVGPIADLVEKIGGGRVDVSVLVPAGKEPETFTPSPKRIAELTRNRLFFRVGLISEESFVPKLKTNAPEMIIIDLREGLDLLKNTSDHDHSHDPNPDHDHDSDDHHAESESENHEGHHCGSNGMDPHIWMSPEILKKMIDRIAGVLSDIDPEGRGIFEKNRDQIKKKLTEIQEEIHEKFKGLSSRILLVFHPAYGYFCREFGLEQLALEKGGKAPKPQDLVFWITTVKDQKLKKIIVQPEFNRNSVKAIVDPLDIQMVDHSPLKKDILESIRELAGIIEK